MSASLPVRHFLITRFNLNYAQTYGDLFRYSDAWMRHRMDLFERFCHPSVLRQTSQNFTWLVYFDRTRTQPYLDRLAPLFDDPRFNAIHINDPAEMLADICSRVGSDMALLTSRLDNDDMLHPDFVARMQACASQKKRNDAPIIIDFPELTWWREGSPRAQRFRSDVVSPFASVLEAPSAEGWAAGPRTVLAGRHDKLETLFGKVENLPEPYSMTILHGNNVSNGQSRFGMVGRMLRVWRDRRSTLSRAETTRVLAEFGLDGKG
ncbi:putative rhamnosyl transferase [Roseibaca sp. V10]|uniref:Rhamnosyl transferase n=1 Tax=Roseinatronobacter domitianus TaxID=2940293 RepID=A0ABT0M2Z0_9RHOB|nr:glycosyltransferase [Roseibaca domitiana]MCL1629208.1 putative rhamnosyl transferase [Roseibaca domitiana]